MATARHSLAKRALDVLLAASVLIALLPFLALVAVVLRFTGEGEVFYRQRRSGIGDRPFFIWKFATMRKDSPTLGTITVRDDPRVLPVGAILRKWKINEIPQLWNVVLGDMSIVGPRPLAVNEFQLYAPETRQKIASVRPGLTGLSALFYRDEERILEDIGGDPFIAYRDRIIPRKAALETWYVDHWSFALDVRIILLTAIAVVHARTRLPERFLPAVAGLVRP